MNVMFKTRKRQLTMRSHFPYHSLFSKELRNPQKAEESSCFIRGSVNGLRSWATVCSKPTSAAPRVRRWQAALWGSFVYVLVIVQNSFSDPLGIHWWYFRDSKVILLWWYIYLFFLILWCRSFSDLLVILWQSSGGPLVILWLSFWWSSDNHLEILRWSFVDHLSIFRWSSSNVLVILWWSCGNFSCDPLTILLVILR